MWRVYFYERELPSPTMRGSMFICSRHVSFRPWRWNDFFSFSFPPPIELRSSVLEPHARSIDTLRNLRKKKKKKMKETGREWEWKWWRYVFCRNDKSTMDFATRVVSFLPRLFIERRNVPFIYLLINFFDEKKKNVDQDFEKTALVTRREKQKYFYPCINYAPRNIYFCFAIGN